MPVRSRIPTDSKPRGTSFKAEQAFHFSTRYVHAHEIVHLLGIVLGVQKLAVVGPVFKTGARCRELCPTFLSRVVASISLVESKQIVRRRNAPSERAPWAEKDFPDSGKSEISEVLQVNHIEDSDPMWSQTPAKAYRRTRSSRYSASMWDRPDCDRPWSLPAECRLLPASRKSSTDGPYAQP